MAVAGPVLAFVAGLLIGAMAMIFCWVAVQLAARWTDEYRQERARRKVDKRRQRLRDAQLDQAIYESNLREAGLIDPDAPSLVETKRVQGNPPRQE